MRNDVIKERQSTPPSAKSDAATRGVKREFTKAGGEGGSKEAVAYGVAKIEDASADATETDATSSKAPRLLEFHSNAVPEPSGHGPGSILARMLRVRTERLRLDQQRCSCQGVELSSELG